MSQAATVDAKRGQLLLRFGQWIIDTTAWTVLDDKSNEEVDLTSMEFELFRAVAEHPRTGLGRDQQLDAARTWCDRWGPAGRCSHYAFAQKDRTRSAQTQFGEDGPSDWLLARSRRLLAQSRPLMG
ncbi:MAG: hypothetical protein AAFR75_09560 [Pseudomonadota bacterium]